MILQKKQQQNRLFEVIFLHIIIILNISYM